MQLFLEGPLDFLGVSATFCLLPAELVLVPPCRKRHEMSQWPQDKMALRQS